MRKNAVAISAAGYAWLQLVYFGVFSAFPGFASSLLQLVFLVLIPLFAGFGQNQQLLRTSPSVWRLLLSHLLRFGAFSALTVWIIYVVQASGALPIHWLAGLSEAIFCTIWQALLWLVGALMAARSPESAQGLPRPAILALSMLTIPAVLLLASFGYPVARVLFTIALWYLSLVFALAASEKGATHAAFTLVYSFFPGLLALALFIGLFSQTFRQMLLGLQNGLSAIQAFIAGLANALYSRLPDYDVNDPAIWNTFKKIRLPEPGSGNPNRSRFVLFLLAGALVLAILWQFARVLRIRLKPRSPGLPLTRFSWKDVFAEFGRSILAMIRAPFKGLLAMARWLIRVLSSWRRTTSAWIRKRLSPRTPAQAAWHTYQKFLRWGAKRGVRRDASETPSEYAERLERHFIAHPSREPFPGQEVRRLTDCFLTIRYGNRAIDWHVVQECHTLLQAIQNRSSAGLPGRS